MLKTPPCQPACWIKREHTKQCKCVTRFLSSALLGLISPICTEEGCLLEKNALFDQHFRKDVIPTPIPGWRKVKLSPVWFGFDVWAAPGLLNLREELQNAVMKCHSASLGFHVLGWGLASGNRRLLGLTLGEPGAVQTRSQKAVSAPRSLRKSQRMDIKRQTEGQRACRRVAFQCCDITHFVLAKKVNWAATGGEMTHKEPNALRKVKTLLVSVVFYMVQGLK